MAARSATIRSTEDLMTAPPRGPRMTIRFTITLATTLVPFAIAAAPPANAQDTDFAGKPVTLYIGNTAGGTYDLMGRLVARHLGRHLPRPPPRIPPKKPGGGKPRAPK